MKNTIHPFLTLVALVFAATTPPRPAMAQSPQSHDWPKVLIVTAHPDDEGMFSATVYKITHELGGKVDLALITDGAGGYRFSTLAEPIYGMKLTDPEIAKQYLPAIRKKELLAAGSIIGIRKYFFFDQHDFGRTNDLAEFLTTDTWDTTYVKTRLKKIMMDGDYDFVFAHLPEKGMHAHHKAATVFALKAARTVPVDQRPVVLAGWWNNLSDAVDFHFDELDGFPITKVDQDFGPFAFDRNQKIGLDGRLNYKIISNWEIAEHKSQGTMQNFLGGRTDEEIYFYFEANDGLGKAAVERLFAELAVPRPAP